MLPACGPFLDHNLLKLFTLRLSWWLLPLMLQPVWQEFKSIWTIWLCASRNQGSGAAGDAGTSFRTRRQSPTQGAGQAGCQDAHSILRPSQQSWAWGRDPPGSLEMQPAEPGQESSLFQLMHQDPSTYDPSVISHFGWRCPRQGDKALPLLAAGLFRAVLGFWVHTPPPMPAQCQLQSRLPAAPQITESLIPAGPP